MIHLRNTTISESVLFRAYSFPADLDFVAVDKHRVDYDTRRLRDFSYALIRNRFRKINFGSFQDSYVKNSVTACFLTGSVGKIGHCTPQLFGGGSQIGTTILVRLLKQMSNRYTVHKSIHVRIAVGG